MKTVPGKSSELWDIKDVLYVACATCKKHLPWMKRHNSLTLTSSCCGYVWDALPRHSFTKFHVIVRHADTTNVRRLSAVDPATYQPS